MGNADDDWYTWGDAKLLLNFLAQNQASDIERFKQATDDFSNAAATTGGGFIAIAQSLQGIEPAKGAAAIMSQNAISRIQAVLDRMPASQGIRLSCQLDPSKMVVVVYVRISLEQTWTDFATASFEIAEEVIFRMTNALLYEAVRTHIESTREMVMRELLKRKIGPAKILGVKTFVPEDRACAPAQRPTGYRPIDIEDDE